jgi:MFS family permease
MNFERSLSPAHNRWIRILGVAFFMHIIAFMDRNNIAMAIPAMRAQLGLSASAIGFTSGALFFSYMVMQVPAGRLAATWSAKRIILISGILWGLASLSTAFVHTAGELLLNRLVMGLVEGGETVTVLVLIRFWFTRPERARATSLFLLSLPLASVIANLISGFILEYLSWQWMFIVEAIPALLWAIVWQIAITDRPAQAQWLAEDEKEWLTAQLAEEERNVVPITGHWTRAMWNPGVLLLTLCHLFALIGALGVVLWLPSVLKATGMSIGAVGIYSAATYGVGMLMMIVTSATSDHFLERKWHVVLLQMLPGIFMLLVAFAKSDPLLTVLCFLCINGFYYGSYGPFWALPSDVLPASVVGVGAGVINGLGNLGGFIGPFMFGYVRTSTNSFKYALILGGVSFLLAALCASLIKVRRRDDGQAAPHSAAAPSVGNA